MTITTVTLEFENSSRMASARKYDFALCSLFHTLFVYNFHLTIILSCDAMLAGKEVYDVCAVQQEQTQIRRLNGRAWFSLFQSEFVLHLGA